LLHQARPAFQKWYGVLPEVTRDLRNLLERDVASHTASNLA
jgi:shikimate dehydrogenase